MSLEEVRTAILDAVGETPEARDRVARALHTLARAAAQPSAD